MQTPNIFPSTYVIHKICKAQATLSRVKPYFDFSSSVELLHFVQGGLHVFVIGGLPGHPWMLEGLDGRQTFLWV